MKDETSKAVGTIDDGGPEKVVHTPAPWKLDEVKASIGRVFRIGDGEMLTAGKGCCCIYDDYPGGSASEKRKANAVRIVACVNALEGVPTEELERIVGIVDPAERFWALGDAVIRAKDQHRRQQIEATAHPR